MAHQIGISFNCYDFIPAKEQAKLIRANGFAATFDMSYNTTLAEDLDACAKEGIAVESLHAPFRGINAMWEEGDAGDAFLSSLKDGVIKCQSGGIDRLVVHLSSSVVPPRINDLGYGRFASLVEFADAHGVRICFENQRVLANLAFALETFPTSGFCWDVGHEECFAGGKRYMPLFGDRLAVLHIHDNLCEPEGDLHLLPFDGKIDFDRVARSIRESGYQGALMLEANRKNSHFYDDFTPEEYFRHAGEGVRRLQKMVDGD